MLVIGQYNIYVKTLQAEFLNPKVLHTVACHCHFSGVFLDMIPGSKDRGGHLLALQANCVL